MAIKLIDGRSSPSLRYQADTSRSFQLSGSACLTAQQQRWQMKLSRHGPKKNKPCSSRILSIYCCSTTIHTRGRKDRINAISLHFITAFLDVHLRGARDKQAYLDVPNEDSDVGTWKAPSGTSWGAYSPGGPDVSLWKGFQQGRARGLILQHLPAAAPQKAE